MPRKTVRQQIQRRLTLGKKTGRERKVQQFMDLISTPHPPVKDRPARSVLKRLTRKQW